ncbi:MAG: 50S ribosomal protein L24 [Hyphomicrobiales bacterium]
MPHFRKNDQVMVIAGDDRGKTGKVLKVLKEGNRLIVEKINFVKRHTKPRSQAQQGGILEREAPVHVSNVMHLCPKCQTGVRIQMKVAGDGKRERYCARCGETIPRVM